MKVLALEFSSPRRSVALCEFDEGTGAVQVLRQVSDEGRRSVTALRLVQQVLEPANLRPEAIKMLVLGLGPGSYTGIRSGIALTQGWQLASAVQLVGLSTIECLAYQRQAKGESGRFTIVVDAQRNEAYLATYQITPTAREILTPLRLATREELLAELAAKRSVLCGPEATKWSRDGQEEIPEAQSLAQLLRDGWNNVPGEKMEPIYLRQTAFVKAPPPRRLPA